MFKKFQICETTGNTPPFPYFKDLQAIDPSFVTIIKPLTNKIGETFCERLKWMCKLFEIDCHRHFVIELTQGNSY